MAGDSEELSRAVSYGVGSSSFSAVSHLLFSGVNLHTLQ
jgi:hypothetical protein